MKAIRLLKKFRLATSVTRIMACPPEVSSSKKENDNGNS
jgi:hypothetical protein